MKDATNHFARRNLFIKHYLELCLAAGVRTQLMDDLAAGLKNFDEMIPASRNFFDRLRE